MRSAIVATLLLAAAPVWAQQTTLGYDAFVNVPWMNSDDLAQRTRAVPLAGLDFGLRAGSAAIDRGTVVPQVTDGYTGVAPDLGALEFGVPQPHYGPRYSPHWL